MPWTNWNHSIKGAFVGGSCALVLGLISAMSFFYKYLHEGQLVYYLIFHVSAAILFGMLLGCCIGKYCDRKKIFKKKKTYAAWGIVIGTTLSFVPPLSIATGYLTEFLLFPLAELGMGFFKLIAYLGIILWVSVRVFWGASIGYIVGALIEK